MSRKMTFSNLVSQSLGLLVCSIFIFAPLAVVSDTGVGFNVTPFNLDAGIVEILAPVYTINFNVVVPNSVLICNSGELRGTDMVRAVSFPSLLELV